MGEMLPPQPTRPPPGAPEDQLAPATAQQMSDLIAATVAKQLRSFKDELLDASPAAPAATAAPMQTESAAAAEAPRSRNKIDTQANQPPPPSAGAAGSTGPMTTTAHKTAGAPPSSLPSWVVKQEAAKGVTTQDRDKPLPEAATRARHPQAAASSSAAAAAIPEEDEDMDCGFDQAEGRSRKRKGKKAHRKDPSIVQPSRNEKVEAVYNRGMGTVDQAISDLRDLEGAFIDASKNRSNRTLEALNHALTNLPKQIRQDLRTVRQDLTALRDEANKSQDADFSILFGDLTREDNQSGPDSTPADTPH